MPDDMSEALRPPILPNNFHEFEEHVAADPSAWFQYFSSAYEHMQQQDLRLQAREHDNRHLAQQLQEQATALATSQGIREYQKEEISTLTQRLVDLARNTTTEKTPAVGTPLFTTPTPAAETLPVPPVGAATPTPPTSTASHQLSERHPDPEKFDGNREDLRRFVHQIHAKLTINADRFTTPAARLGYVAGRLTGDAYKLVLASTRFGIPQFPDYPELLVHLEKAYGDPNRVRNARRKLDALRQTNQEFSRFYAEFQRLALEGDMPNEALPAMLERAISRELKSMLMHSPADNELDTHALADHLQILDNRYREFQTPALRPIVPTKSPAPARSSPAATFATPATYAVAAKPSAKQDPDAMDLSRSRRPQSPARPGNRYTNRECFRCGAKDHYVRDCLKPDTRPALGSTRVTSPPRSPPSAQPRLRSPVLQHPQPVHNLLFKNHRIPSPTNSVNSINGVSLPQVADRL